MRQTTNRPAAIAALVFVLASAAAAVQQPPAPAQSAEGQPVPGQEVFRRLCTECHGSEDITTFRRSRDQWEDVIEKMTDRGATGTDKELATVLRYLLTRYGRVNVNKAPAADLVQVLGVSTEEAEAIVKYRSEQGPLSNFDALVKVPGVEPKKLEKIRDAISF